MVSTHIYVYTYSSDFVTLKQKQIVQDIYKDMKSV